ncbi:MAG: hypothetical protein ACM3NO_04825 [Deltaproteobacteria bacterium]
MEITGVIIYALLAIGILLASFWLFLKGTASTVKTVADETTVAFEPLDLTSLRLAERIFDPADRDWLRNEVCFPQAAEALERHRKTLAIHWLKAFRNSFNELVRTPVIAPGESSSAGSSSLETFWLMLRFQFLIAYALLMVKAFGPYHRIVPILGPLHSLGKLGFSKARLGQAAVQRIR